MIRTSLIQLFSTGSILAAGISQDPLFHPPSHSVYLTAGPFYEPRVGSVPQALGAEASLIAQRCSGRERAIHNFWGMGLAAGLSTSKAYIEPELVLQFSHDQYDGQRTGHGYPVFFFTLGGGFFHRVNDDYPLKRGWQWTVSGLFAYIPILVYVRTQDTDAEDRVTNAGVMVKYPLELLDTWKPKD